MPLLAPSVIWIFCGGGGGKAYSSCWIYSKTDDQEEEEEKVREKDEGDISIKFLPRNPEQVFLSSSFKSWE